MSIWVLVSEYNDYDQHGAYYVYAWDHKPTKEELLVHLKDHFDFKEFNVNRESNLECILNGGGVGDYPLFSLIAQ